MEYSEKFEIAHKHVHSVEGGFVEHKNDPGGVTNHGISLRFLEDYAKTSTGRKILNSLNIGHITRQTIVSLKAEQAKLIYYNAFWLAPKINELPAKLSVITYDFAVNSGSFYAVKVLQKAIGASVDGVIGPNTIMRALKADVNKTASLMLEERAKFYIRLAKQKPQMEVFLKGWLNRVEALKDYLNTIKE